MKSSSHLKPFGSESAEKGYSLVETLIALFTLMIALLGLATLMSVALLQNEFAEYDTKAVQVAQSKVEELKSLYSRQIESGDLASDLAAGSHGPQSVTLRSSDAGRQGQLSFLVSWAVTELGGGLKSVSVSVSPLADNSRVNEVLTVNSSLAP